MPVLSELLDRKIRQFVLGAVSSMESSLRTAAEYSTPDIDGDGEDGYFSVFRNTLSCMTQYPIFHCPILKTIRDWLTICQDLPQFDQLAITLARQDPYTGHYVPPEEYRIQLCVSPPSEDTKNYIEPGTVLLFMKEGKIFCETRDTYGRQFEISQNAIPEEAFDTIKRALTHQKTATDQNLNIDPDIDDTTKTSLLDYASALGYIPSKDLTPENEAIRSRMPSGLARIWSLLHRHPYTLKTILGEGFTPELADASIARVKEILQEVHQRIDTHLADILRSGTEELITPQEESYQLRKILLDDGKKLAPPRETLPSATPTPAASVTPVEKAPVIFHL